jgi:hypothetical protein
VNSRPPRAARAARAIAGPVYDQRVSWPPVEVGVVRLLVLVITAVLRPSGGWGEPNRVCSCSCLSIRVATIPKTNGVPCSLRGQAFPGACVVGQARVRNLVYLVVAVDFLRAVRCFCV